MARRGFPMPETRVESRPDLAGPAASGSGGARHTGSGSGTMNEDDVVMAGAGAGPETDDALSRTGAGAGAGRVGGDSAGAGGGRPPESSRASDDPAWAASGGASSVRGGTSTSTSSGAGLPGPADESKDGGSGNKDAWRNFQPGQHIDVCDTVGKWCDAIVADVDADTVFVHYVYWSSKYDERVSRTSARLAKYRSHIYYEGGELKRGQRVDVFDRHETRRKWCKGEVVDALEDKVLVHFHGWTSRWDEWHPRDSDYLAPCGRYTAVARAYRPKASHFWRNRKRDRLIAETAEGWPRYCAALDAMGMRIKGCEGDGNCLFRAVSHQLYGDDSHHAIVRASAVEYMAIHRQFFQPFVAYNAADFDRYLEYKRRDGVWGDDPEIQAMCEMYNRPAHLYVYHPVKGATKLRTFHETGPDGVARPPLRLSYYGGGHYDSVVLKSGDADHFETRPGVQEANLLALAKSQVAAAEAAAAADASATPATSAEGKVEDSHEALAPEMRHSRQQFDANDVNVEDAMIRQMSATSDAEATQNAIMAQVMRASRSRDLEDLERKQLEEAKTRSREELDRAAAAAGGSAEDAAAAAAAAAARKAAEDRELFRAMAASEQESLKKAEEDSLAAALKASRSAADALSAEDAFLQAALAKSRAEAGVVTERDLMLGMATVDDGDHPMGRGGSAAGMMASAQAAGTGALAGDAALAAATFDEPMDPDTLLALQLSMMQDD